MTHRSEHVHAAVYIIYIRPNLLAHGQAVAGAVGAGEDVDRSIVIFSVEDGLHLGHDLLVAGKGAGGDSHCLAADLHFAALVLGQDAADRSAVVCQDLLGRGVIEHLAAVLLQDGQQLPAHIPAVAAGADHGVDALLIHGLHIGADQPQLIEHAAFGKGEVLAQIVVLDEPVKEIAVGIQNPAHKLGIDLSFGLPDEFLIGLVPLVGHAQILVPLGVVHLDLVGVIGASADLLALLENDDLRAAVSGPGSTGHAGAAAADDHHVTLHHDLLVGCDLLGGCVRI